MQNIHFICSAPLEYQIDDLSLYKSFDAVSSGKRDASLAKDAYKHILNAKFEFNRKRIGKIFSAPRGQTYDTAGMLLASGLFPDAKHGSTELLENVSFAMSQLMSEQEFSNFDSEQAIQIARRRFVQYLYADRLSESLSALLKRFDRLLALIALNPYDVLCVGHSFFPKFTPQMQPPAGLFF